MERTYIISLRKSTMLAPRTRRSKKAVLALKAYLAKHMKAQDIKLSQALNEHIWANGMRNPALKVKVIAVKDDKQVVRARLYTESESASTNKPDKKTKTHAKKALESQVSEETTETKPATESETTAVASKAPEVVEAQVVEETPKASKKKAK